HDTRFGVRKVTLCFRIRRGGFGIRHLRRLAPDFLSRFGFLLRSLFKLGSGLRGLGLRKRFGFFFEFGLRFANLLQPTFPSLKLLGELIGPFPLAKARVFFGVLRWTPLLGPK